MLEFDPTMPDSTVQGQIMQLLAITDDSTFMELVQAIHDEFANGPPGIPPYGPLA